MKTVRVYRLHPSPALAARLKAAQMEAAAVWNTCCTLHKNARQQQSPWPGQHEMQQAVSKEQGRVVVPMGKGRKSLVLPLALPEEAGACTLVWHRGFELYVCGFTGHRDLVGSVNMHTLAYGTQVMFPRSFTYLRHGMSRSSSRADTPQCCLSELHVQPRILDMVSSETGHSCDDAQKPVSL
jgi:hypothetical protein